MERLFSQELNPHMDMEEFDAMLAEFKQVQLLSAEIATTDAMKCCLALCCCTRRSPRAGTNAICRNRSSCPEQYLSISTPQDYNQRHFVRNASFKDAADKISGPTRKIFIEFLERSCTAEFSGFLLYKVKQAYAPEGNAMWGCGLLLMSWRLAQQQTARRGLCTQNAQREDARQCNRRSRGLIGQIDPCYMPVCAWPGPF
jgi:hypothetical protein